MSGEITLGIRDLITLLAGIGAPLAVYVGMRTALTRVETQLATVLETMRELRAGRDTHADGISEIREQLASHEARIRQCEQHRPQTGSFQAVSADQTGPHGR